MFFSFINLWCSKNLVDTQFLLWKILEKYSVDFFYDSDPFSKEVELVFLNTCWFISSWREEMFDTVEELLKKKKRVCLLWCAVQYFEKLVKENNLSDDETKQWEILKGNDNISFLSWNDVVNFSPEMLGNSKYIPSDYARPEDARAYTNIDFWYEYLKIAEWCNNQCAFCIIPKIRGKQVSQSIEKVIEDAQNLIQQGVKEIILIAQDSTRYWIDLYGKPQLFELLEQLDKIDGDFKYRVLYLYPDLLTKQHLKRLISLKKFIPYFDIPLQHSSPKLLKAMGRFYDYEMSLEFIKYIRENFDGAFIRTNFIIGFPWESQEDFDHLLDFIGKDYFDNIALFEYHDEPLALSYQFADKLDEKIIRERFKKVSHLWDELSSKRRQKRRGKEFIWIISDIQEWKSWRGNTYIVRPELVCPEIDEEDEIQDSDILEYLDEEVTIGSRIRYVLP